ncbi:MAG: preprotein translocase subunit Sec61beta [Candidatus Marsarchaeota archaeon]|jgi:preprotein translocase subunit Sec61beta|nr:preprotein translocase subunit Sec61beta [Candidatus Marsarchaeota archaeon]
MATIGSPQSQAGIMSFYDAQTSGPKLNPKIIIAFILIFVVIVLIMGHIIYYG